VTGRPPLWTPEEARAEAEREGAREDNLGDELAGCFSEGCVINGCLNFVPAFCLVLAVVLVLR
jgi:hypothetical protein